MPRRIPTIGRVVASDYATLLCVIGPVVGWGLWLALDVAGLGSREGDPRVGEPFLLLLAIVVTALCVPLGARRVRGIIAVFRDGLEVEGRVVGLDFHGDRGVVEVEFAHEGREERVARAIAKNARTAALRVGQVVVLVVDPADPARAFIRDLFV